MEIKFGTPMKYKEICRVFNDESKPSNNTNGRKAQLKEWNKQYEVIKNKTWYIITKERTEEEKQETYEQEMYKKYKIQDEEKEKQFNVSFKDRHSSGIYKIQLDNIVYVGQTNDFHKRFVQHYYYNYPTHNLLENGAIFSVIEKCGSQKEKDILEEKYIKQYCKDESFNCININLHNYKIIKFDYTEWDRAKRLLDEEGVKYYDK